MLSKFLIAITLAVIAVSSHALLEDEVSLIHAEIAAEEHMVAERALRRRRRRRRKKSKFPPNHAVCHQLLDSWWDTRLAQKIRASAVALDATCGAFTASSDQCNYKSERTGALSAAQTSAACTIVGAKSRRCMGNPCNHLNEGTCSIQETAGQCVWWTQSQVNTMNTYYANNNIREPDGSIRKIGGEGCYRNPCNEPGYGKKPRATCHTKFVPNVYQCTYCIGGYFDRRLKGKGMGCQLTVPTTTAGCKPVNNAKVPKSSIWIKGTNSDCQCSDEYPLCQEEINKPSISAGTTFRKRFP